MNSPLRYFGGKSRVAERIIERIPEHKTYAEIFGGAAWVLFKKAPSKQEVLNDLDQHLMNFYRIAKAHPDALIQELAAFQPGREIFNVLKDDLERPLLTDVQRAAAYFFVQKNSFAGRPRNASLAIKPGRCLTHREEVFRRVLPQVSGRLKQVFLENIPWERLVKLYDSVDTFFFIDPPYMGKSVYRHNFTERDFKELAKVLCAVKGHFLMTHVDSDLIRRVFGGFNFEEIAVPYSAQQASGKPAKSGREIFITNY